jgi:hypothetical protein
MTLISIQFHGLALRRLSFHILNYSSDRLRSLLQLEQLHAPESPCILKPFPPSLSPLQLHQLKSVLWLALNKHLVLALLNLPSHAGKT